MNHGRRGGHILGGPPEAQAEEEEERALAVRLDGAKPSDAKGGAPHTRARAERSMTDRLQTEEELRREILQLKMEREEERMMRELQAR